MGGSSAVVLGEHLIAIDEAQRGVGQGHDKKCVAIPKEARQGGRGGISRSLVVALAKDQRHQ